MPTIALVFGECVEDGSVGYKGISGFSYQDLINIYNLYPERSMLYDLAKLGEINDLNISLPGAWLLVIKKPFQLNNSIDVSNDLVKRLCTPEMYGGVDWQACKTKNKKGVSNVIFTELNDWYKTYIDKGVIYNYRNIPELHQIQENLSCVANTNLVIEGELYNNSSNNTFYGDINRKRHIGYILGDTIQLIFQWFCRTLPITKKVAFQLEHGDVYLMSEKATGHDWKGSSKASVRHLFTHYDT